MHCSKNRKSGPGAPPFLKRLKGQERDFHPSRSCSPGNPCIRNSPHDRSGPASSSNRPTVWKASGPKYLQVFGPFRAAFGDLRSRPFLFPTQGDRPGEPWPVGRKKGPEKKDGRQAWEPMGWPFGYRRTRSLGELKVLRLDRIDKIRIAYWQGREKLVAHRLGHHQVFGRGRMITH